MFVYDDPSNHVETRPGLSAELRRQLFDIPRELWMRHPRMGGEAEFWLQIHQGLLGASAGLAAWTRDLIALDDAVAMVRSAQRVGRLGAQLVHHAHGHHEIEDHHFFPLFLRAFPQLTRLLDLLESDHRVLAELLGDIETALTGFAEPVQGGDGQIRDEWRRRSEALLAPALRLDALFIRHIGDEEEICVPAMLQG